MTLEDTTKLIELRPHHVELFCYGWMVSSDKEIQMMLEKKGYDENAVRNMYMIWERLFRNNMPILIVPGTDEVCQICNKRKENIAKCLNPDPLEYNYLEFLKDLFKEPSLSVGGIYFPNKLAEGAMETLETWASWSIRDEDMLRRIVRKIAAYQSRYERLRMEAR